MRPSAHALVYRAIEQYGLLNPVIDIGGMEYAGWEGIDRMTMDFEGNPDIKADITHMPRVRPNAVGTYICLDVLEHCKYPWKAIPELFRTLQHGGLLILSVPFTWEYHQHPEDYWRFSLPAVKMLCSEAGFKELESDWMTEQFETNVYDKDNDRYMWVGATMEKSCCYYIGRKP